MNGRKREVDRGRKEEARLCDYSVAYHCYQSRHLTSSIDNTPEGSRSI
jgi:hypothetical protein